MEKNACYFLQIAKPRVILTQNLSTRGLWNLLFPK